MTDMFGSLINKRDFEEFEYRLLYLRPSYHSDERIAVGIVSNSVERLDVRFISSVSSLEMMSRLLGEEGVEQFQFAAGELRRAIPAAKSLDALSMPTDLLVGGETIAAFTKDRRGFLTSILDSASCLIRSTTSRGEIVTSPGTVAFSKELFEQVSRLSPILATKIFNRQINVEGKTVDVPILGRNIFGAPVSFAGSTQIMRAESYIAKFLWLRRYLRQQPTVYVLAAQDGRDGGRHGVEAAMVELTAIAQSAQVDLTISDSPVELASLVIRDEAATNGIDGSDDSALSKNGEAHCIGL